MQFLRFQAISIDGKRKVDIKDYFRWMEMALEEKETLTNDETVGEVVMHDRRMDIQKMNYVLMSTN